MAATPTESHIDPRSPRLRAQASLGLDELSLDDNVASDTSDETSCSCWSTKRVHPLTEHWTVNQQAMLRLQREDKVDAKTHYVFVKGRLVAQGETRRDAVENAGDALDQVASVDIDCYRGDVELVASRKPVALAP